MKLKKIRLALRKKECSHKTTNLKVFVLVMSGRPLLVPHDLFWLTVFFLA